MTRKRAHDHLHCQVLMIPSHLPPAQNTSVAPGHPGKSQQSSLWPTRPHSALTPPPPSSHFPPGSLPLPSPTGPRKVPQAGQALSHHRAFHWPLFCLKCPSPRCPHGSLTPPFPSALFFILFIFYLSFWPFLGLLPQHMEVPRLGVESEL